MSKIYAGAANYVPKNTTKTIHAGPCKIRNIILTGDAAGNVTFYDNTAGSGTILLVLDLVSGYTPNFQYTFDVLMPLVCAVGLTIVTSANARCFVITEA